MPTDSRGPHLEPLIFLTRIPGGSTRVLPAEFSLGGLSSPPGATQHLLCVSPTRARKPLTLRPRRRVRILTSPGAETAGGADARPQETWLLEVSGQTPRRPRLKRRFVLHLIQLVGVFPKRVIGWLLTALYRLPTLCAPTRSRPRPVAILNYLVVVDPGPGPKTGQGNLQPL